MSGRNQFTAAQFIEAIKGTGKYEQPGKHTGCMGIISTVADRLGCNWHTAKKYCARDKTPFVTVADAFEDEAERALDFAETQMFKQIQEGDGPMIRYLLSTKGKNRGFAERQQIDLRSIDLSQLTEQQLQRLADGDDLFRVLTTQGEG
jgi:hypothetical protein